MTGILTIVAAVGAGVVAGVLFGFSSFVMPALDRLAPDRALTAMQSINREAPRSAWFMAALFGTAATSLVVGGSALAGLSDPGAGYRLAGSLLYLVVIVVTGAYHVPRNDALGLVDPDASNGADHWHRYSPGWTAWNHVRTLAAIGAAVTLMLGYAAR